MKTSRELTKLRSLAIASSRKGERGAKREDAATQPRTPGERGASAWHRRDWNYAWRKRKPASMVGHRHSRATLVNSPGPLHRLPCHAPLLCANSTLADETLPVRSAARSPRSISLRGPPGYHCETIGYLSLRIWHIVKLIERG